MSPSLCRTSRERTTAVVLQLWAFLQMKDLEGKPLSERHKPPSQPAWQLWRDTTTSVKPKRVQDPNRLRKFFLSFSNDTHNPSSPLKTASLLRLMGQDPRQPHHPEKQSAQKSGRTLCPALYGEHATIVGSKSPTKPWGEKSTLLSHACRWWRRPKIGGLFENRTQRKQSGVVALLLQTPAL